MLFKILVSKQHQASHLTLSWFVWVHIPLKNHTNIFCLMQISLHNEGKIFLQTFSVEEFNFPPKNTWMFCKHDINCLPTILDSTCSCLVLMYIPYISTSNMHSIVYNNCLSDGWCTLTLGVLLVYQPRQSHWVERWSSETGVYMCVVFTCVFCLHVCCVYMCMCVSMWCALEIHVPGHRDIVRCLSCMGNKVFSAG